MNLELYFQIFTSFLSSISLIANIWVSYVYFSFKELQQHPSTILSWISIFEISMSHHSLALIISTNFSIHGHGPHYMIQMLSLFTINESNARSISCAINQMLFSGSVAGVLCYNTAMSIDLIITLRNPLIPGKARMKYYHSMTLILVSLSMIFNGIQNSKYTECHLTAFDYLYQVWNFGLLTIVYFFLLSSAVLSILFIALKGKEEINDYTKKYLNRHVCYLVIVTLVWTCCMSFFWLERRDKGAVAGDHEKEYLIIANLVIVSASGAVQAMMRNWEPVFWNCSKSLCRKRPARGSLMSSGSSFTLARDFKDNEDMWNMPMSFIIQENMKSQTTLCILSGICEAIGVSELNYKTNFQPTSEIKAVKYHKVLFSVLRAKVPSLSSFSHPYFVIKEYCPVIFQRLRLLEGEDKEYFMNSLDPKKNEKVIFSLQHEQGGSGSVFIFTEDSNLVIKIVQQSERKSFIKGFLLEYLNHIERNCMSLLNRIFGVYTVKIPGLAPLDIILTQGLLRGALLKYYDLKGSSVKRSAELIDPQNFKGPYKDLDFINDEKLCLQEEIVAELTHHLMKDFRFLLEQEIMDYSLIISFLRTQAEKCVFDIENNRWCRFGIIDFLGKYSMKRKAEYYLKKLRYGKKIKMCSVMKPINYYKRIVKFIFKKVLMVKKNFK